MQAGVIRQRGAILVLALAVAAALAVVGAALVLVGETDHRVARNERLTARADYLAEGVARQVTRWFDRPQATSAHLAFPDPEAVDRTLRIIDVDGDGPAPAVLADGTPARPRYKQDSDLDGDGIDDLFRRPFRGGLAHLLVGTAAGPDLRIDEHGSPGERLFLDTLSGAFDDPDAGRTEFAARVARIDLHAPPILPTDTGWVRHGIGTIRVVAGLYRRTDPERQLVSRASVAVVLHEIPYGGPFGPLHACGDLDAGPLRVRWGAVTAEKSLRTSANHLETAVGLPRDTSTPARLDLLKFWSAADTPSFLAYRAAIEGMVIEDPWLRVLSGGPASPALCEGWSERSQPCPFLWEGGPLASGQLPHHSDPARDGTHSNVFHNVAGIGCAVYEYHSWKRFAQSSGSGARYFAWAGGDRFRENGRGPDRTFREHTNGEAGLLFFDTIDGRPPVDRDGDGEWDNLTPDVVVSGGEWGVRGFIYLNARLLRLDTVGRQPVDFRAPGEPFQDRDRDGDFDEGEAWINVAYPGTLDGEFLAVANDSFGGGVRRNAAGPPIPGLAVLDGILYTSGRLDLAGRGRVYGSVIAGLGAIESEPNPEGVEFFWNSALAESWPPSEGPLPIVHARDWSFGP